MFKNPPNDLRKDDQNNHQEQSQCQQQEKQKQQQQEQQQQQQQQLYEDQQQNDQEQKLEQKVKQQQNQQNLELQQIYQILKNQEQFEQADILPNQDKDKDNENQKQKQEEQQSPKQLKLLENADCLIWIQKLYNESCNARDVPEEFKCFVGPPQNQKALMEYYAGDDKGIQEFLQAQLQGFRRIRGDGNCFYTAFVYQYLNLLLKGDESEIKKIKSMTFCMKYDNNYEIPQEKQNQLAICFYNRLLQIKQQPNIELALYEAISNPNDTFYGLSILYIRNLVNQLYLANQMAKQIVDEDLSQDFLFWEKECNYNEVVISFLASDLNLQIKVILVDSLNSVKNCSVYGDEGNQKIHLILAPGHYQIGLP